MRRKILAIILWITLSVAMIFIWYICFNIMGYKTTKYINDTIKTRIEISNGDESNVLSHMVNSAEINNPSKNFKVCGTILGISVVLYVPLTIGCYTLGWKRKEDKHDDREKRF